MYNLTQKLTAEFVGTFALIFFGEGAICVDMQLRSNATGGDRKSTRLNSSHRL